MTSSLLRPDSYARNTLERYTGSSVDEFGPYILLCNFPRYAQDFAEKTGCGIKSGYWDVVHDPVSGVSIINYGVGSPSSGIIMHCLSFLDKLECVIMLGMCGGIADDLEVGDIIIPTASIRDEGTSQHYLPKDVPAQPGFWINRISEEVITERTGKKPKNGIMLTTDYRMWEFDQEFIDYILKHRILAIDMEIATLFSVGYALNVPTGAIMLVSDLPLRKGGIKSKDSAKEIFCKFTDNHLRMGIEIMATIRGNIEKNGKQKEAPCQAPG